MSPHMSQVMMMHSSRKLAESVVVMRQEVVKQLLPLPHFQPNQVLVWRMVADFSLLLSSSPLASSFFLLAPVCVCQFGLGWQLPCWWACCHLHDKTRDRFLRKHHLFRAPILQQSLPTCSAPTLGTELLRRVQGRGESRCWSDLACCCLLCWVVFDLSHPSVSPLLPQPNWVRGG